MKQTWNWMILLFILLGVILVLSACATPNKPRADADEISAEQTKSIFVNPPEEIKDHTDSIKNHSKIDPTEIHEDGISSYLETILSAEGLTGIKVFMIGDSVVLARNKVNLQEDHAQNDHLTKAAAVMDDTFDGTNKVLTITDPEAVDLIIRIQDNIKKASYKKAGDDISQLLQMAK